MDCQYDVNRASQDHVDNKNAEKCEILRESKEKEQRGDKKKEKEKRNATVEFTSVKLTWI